MSGWLPIESAPKDGTAFLAWQDGEVYLAHYTDDKEPRLCFRTHDLWVQSKHRVISAVMDGREVKAQVAVEEPWAEQYQHCWTLWTRGFAFKPTLWAPLEPPGGK